MSTLVVYYSFEGNTKFIAERIAEALHADLTALTTSKKYPVKGLQKYVWGGKSVLLGEQPELTNVPIDLNAYDTLILGTPVWAGSYAPPVNTFLNQYKIEGKTIGLFACHGGGGAEKCFGRMKEKLGNNVLIGEAEFQDPLKGNTDENAKKAADWASGLPI
jgi:flavodoxin